MGLSNVYGPANDEESKEVLRHAIKIGCVRSNSTLDFIKTSDKLVDRHSGIRT